MKELAAGLAEVVFGCEVVGVRFGKAELGVSGYAIENGPGVCVLCEG